MTKCRCVVMLKILYSWPLANEVIWKSGYMKWVLPLWEHFFAIKTLGNGYRIKSSLD